MKKFLAALVAVAMLMTAHVFTGASTVSALTMDVWTTSSYENVFKDATKPGGAVTAVEWVAAKNEYESAQIMLRADTAFTITSVSFTNLTSGGNTISSSNLSYNFVGYFPLLSNSNGFTNVVRSGAGDYPEYLLNDASIAVAANTTQPIWITVYVPKTAVEATYTGTVTVNTSAGTYNASISLEVHDVEIPDTDEAALDLFFWQWTAGWYNFADSADEIENRYGYTRYSTEWWELMDKFADSAKAHRLNHYLVPTVTLLHNGGTTVDSGGTYTFDWSRFDEVIQFFIDRGWVKGLVGNQLAYRENPADFNVSPFKVYIIKRDGGNVVRTSVDIGSADADNFLSQFLPALQSHLVAKSWDDIWYQHVADEPTSLTQTNQWEDLADAIDTYAPGMRTMEAFLTQEYANRYIGKMDVWVPMLDTYDYNPAFYNNRKTAGDKVWFYTALFPNGNWLNRMIDQPVWMSRSLLWYAFKQELGGFLHWGWNAWHSAGYMNGPNWGDAATVHPDATNGDIFGSIRHEAVRDGAEDYELLKILEATDPILAKSLAGSIVASGTSYSTSIAKMMEKRADLVRAAAGNLPPLAPGTLFSDDFEDGDATGWSAVHGSWAVDTDGTDVYKQSSASGEGLATAGDVGWTNYTIEAKVKLYKLDNGDAAGIVARYTDSNNFYMLRLGNVSGTTKVQLYEKTGGTFSLLDDETLVANTNQWYTLKLKMEGSNLTGYVDGVPLVSATDGSHSAGKIGARSYTSSFALDDVLVTIPPLFIDDFEDGNANGWTAVSGAWAVAIDGTDVYKQSGTSGEGLAHAGNSAWTDYSYEARIKLYDLHYGDAAGIVARYTDSNNFYMLRLGNLSGTTKLQLYKKAGGSFTLLDDAEITVNTNQWYELRLVLDGEDLTGYVDDTLLVFATDASHGSGGIGLRSFDNAFAADDIVVY